LDFTRFAGLSDDRYVLRSVTDEIMVALQRIGGQRYDDVYASTVKERLEQARNTEPVTSGAPLD
ncbi:MAG TPA: 1-acyl-sn-glycerol-3-phosphate acyltransferase, partial [Microbacterium ginsengisoli]|nr:1-acyl-sn-glycerol-3-phosphate acyltransferase [Microbacterium ginsengisoli]